MLSNFENGILKLNLEKSVYNSVGLQLWKMYESAKIQTENDFKEALKHVLSDC